MPRKFATSIDLTLNQLLNALFQNLAAAPAGPKAGQVYWDTAKKEVGIYNGAAWVYVAGAASGISEARALELIAEKINGLAWKAPVRLASAAALPANTQSGAGPTGKLEGNVNGALEVDGTAVAVGDRLLVKNEATGAHNGIYTVTAKGGAAEKWLLARSEDAATGAEMLSATTRIEIGTANKGKTYTCNTPPAIVVDTTSLEFVEIESALEIKADGTYLQRTGNTIEPKFNPESPAEPAAEGEVNAGVLSSLRVYKTAFRTKAGTNSYTITHNLNTELLMVQCFETGAKKPTIPIELDWEVSGLNKVVIKFPEAPANTMYDVIIAG